MVPADSGPWRLGTRGSGSGGAMGVAVLLGGGELAGDLVDLVLHALEEGGVTASWGQVVVHQFNYKIIRQP
jgi:hypothetical protein